MVRRLVEHEEVRAARRPSTASASRRRSPPESTATGFSCASQPEKRKRPSRFCASGRARPVIDCDALEDGAARVELHLLLREVADLDAVADAGRRPRRCTSCLEQRRLAGAVRPDERDVLAALERERSRLEQQSVARRRDTSSPSASTTVAAAARGLEELEAEAARPAREQRDLAGGRGALLLEPADLRQLRLRLLRLVLLVAEPLDEALEPHDVALRRASTSFCACSIRAAFSRRHACHGPGKNVAAARPRARASPSSPPRGTSGRARRGSRRRRARRARARATRGSRRRGGSSARRGGADRGRRRARARARRASARRPRTCAAGGRGRSSAKPSPRRTDVARSRHA